MKYPEDNCYIDVHIIQSMPPSCVNRDDTGSPKTGIYGGVNRARVSSQAWKKAIKKAMKDSYLTRLGSHLVADEMRRQADVMDGEDARELAEWIKDEGNSDALKTKAFEFIAKVSKVKAESGNPVATNVLILFSKDEIRSLATSAIRLEVIERKFEKKNISKTAYDTEVKDLTAEARTIFLKSRKTAAHLFGRMLADDKDLGVDACVQVAHALSTHKVSNEHDYYTAVDDVKETQGAGFVSVSEFNSSTLYRYATVAAHDLFRNAECPENAKDLISSFVNHFVTTIPTGKQNTFANHTPPEKVFIAIRTDRPISLAAAFEKPVVIGFGEDSGYNEKSVNAMFDYYSKKIKEGLVSPPAKAMATGSCPDTVEEKSFPEILTEVGEIVSRYYASREAREQS